MFPSASLSLSTVLYLSSTSIPFPPSLLSLPSILTGLRDVCVDWLNGEPVEDPAMKGEKDPKAGFKVEVPRKAVRPSSTQVCVCVLCVHACACVCACARAWVSVSETVLHFDKQHILQISPYLLSFVLGQRSQLRCPLKGTWPRS